MKGILGYSYYRKGAGFKGLKPAPIFTQTVSRTTVRYFSETVQSFHPLYRSDYSTRYAEESL